MELLWGIAKSFGDSFSLVSEWLYSVQASLHSTVWHLPLFAAIFLTHFPDQNKSNFDYFDPFYAFVEGFGQIGTQKWNIRVEKLDLEKPDFDASWPQLRTFLTLCTGGRKGKR